MRWRVLGQPADAEVAVIVADDVERLLIGRNTDAVRLAGVGDDAVHRAVRVDAIDRLHRLLDRFVAADNADR